MKKTDRRMLFSACALRKGKIYGFTDFGAIPVEVDLMSEELSYVNGLQNYQLFHADTMLNVGDSLLAFELNGERMMLYDLKKKECFYYHVGCDKTQWDNYAAFGVYKEEVYIFPTYANEIIKINMKSGNIQKDGRLYLEINEHKNQKEQEDSSYFYCGCQVDNIIWLFQKKGRLAVTYDLKTGTWKKYTLLVQIDSCVHAIHYADKLYLLSSEGKIYCWDMKDDSLELVMDCSSSDTDSSTFARIAVTDKNIFLLPALGEDIFCMDLSTKHIEKYENYPDGFEYCCPEVWSKYFGYSEDEENYYFAMRPANFMLSVNKKTGKEKWIKFKLPSWEEYIRMYIKYNKSLLSEKECRIDDVLNYSEDELMARKGEDINSFGKQIWKQMKRG